VYQTKPRLNAFDQPSFLRPKKPVDTFWDDDDIRPFRLSIPEHFNAPAAKVFSQKQYNEPVRNYAPQREQQREYPERENRSESRPANRQQQRQHAPQPHAQQPRPFSNRQSESYIYNRPHSTLVSYFVQKIYTNWIAKELYFSMSKLSFLVLIIGLFFLSSLLFITGFLVAVNIYDIGAPKLPPITNMNIPYPSMNMPTIETPRLPAPPSIAIPGMPSVSMPGIPAITPSVAMVPAAPNPNIMKMGTQGTQMADTPIVDTARMPSIYAQPAQTLPPTQQPMPQSGGRYISPQQQAPAAQHMPSQGYTQQQSPYPQQTVPVQAPTQQPYTQQAYAQPVNQPMQQSYQPNPGPYYQTGAR
jgi:hypothetical protein